MVIMVKIAVMGNVRKVALNHVERTISVFCGALSCVVTGVNSTLRIGIR